MLWEDLREEANRDAMSNLDTPLGIGPLVPAAIPDVVVVATAEFLPRETHES
jgi:hypothetical protein